MTDKKTLKETEAMDDVEKFLNEENLKVHEELKDIQEELKRMYQLLSQHLDVLDKEILAAFNNGDEKTWVSLTGRKAILLERLAELEHIIRKQ